MRRALTLLVWLLLAPAASAQDFGKLLSPGPLARPHAHLEGLTLCAKCHEPRKQVSAARCLACHPAIQERIAAGKGVHREAGSCSRCHLEHAGRGADLRRLDPETFDHTRETGFALDGRHAPVARECGRCHKTRSFLTASPACRSCHRDPHQGTLGTECARCHSAAVAFAETRRSFDHAITAFPLTGRHTSVRCESCHPDGRYRGVRFASCADCHKDPHDRPLGTCHACHTTESFRTHVMDHGRTAFPLRGRHALVPCSGCHKEPVSKAKPVATSCRSCHADPHRSLFPEDCAACHRETGFAGAAFDHAGRTRFPLEGRHQTQPCSACHKPSGADAAAVAAGAAARTVEFRGARAACSSCHADVHRGQLGTACESCHTPRSFRVATFTHRRFPEFFVGRHATAPCVRCHPPDPAGGPRRFRSIPLACSGCHADPHLGQLGSSCKPCHSPAAPGFALRGFDHDRSRFALSGKHADPACAACHKCEDGDFPAGGGTAVRYVPLATECVACHRDVHLGVKGTRCQSCHDTRTFVVPAQPHADAARRGLKGSTPDCYSCHRLTCEDTRNPDHASAGFGTRCSACHQATDPSWALGRYEHSAWPLVGAHAEPSCLACHGDGVYRGLSSRCVSCHLGAYQKAERPHHAGEGYSTSCERCHQIGDTSWHDAILLPE